MIIKNEGFSKTSARHEEINGVKFIVVQSLSLGKKFYLNCRGMSAHQRGKMRIDCIRIIRRLETISND